MTLRACSVWSAAFYKRLPYQNFRWTVSIKHVLRSFNAIILIFWTVKKLPLYIQDVSWLDQQMYWVSHQERTSVVCRRLKIIRLYKVSKVSEIPPTLPMNIFCLVQIYRYVFGRVEITVFNLELSHISIFISVILMQLYV